MQVAMVLPLPTPQTPVDRQFSAMEESPALPSLRHKTTPPHTHTQGSPNIYYLEAMRIVPFLSDGWMNRLIIPPLLLQ